MHAFEFLQQKPGLEGLKPLYAVVGEDPYLRREVLQAISRATGEEEFAPARFNGDSTQLVDVLDELATLPFFSEHRIAVVDAADNFVTGNRKALEVYADEPARTGTLVLCVKTWPATTRLAKLFAAKGVAVECKSPAESELPGWLVQFASQKCEARLSRETARLLVDLVGTEVGILASEVEKLAVYVGDRKEITAEDVKKLSGSGRIETIWRVLDAATTGRPSEALDLLDRLLTSGEYPAGLLAAMSASLRKVYHAGQLRRARKSVPEACREAGIPTYPGAMELLRKQHAHLGPDRVERLPETLLKADLDLKGFSQLPPRIVLERLLVSLAQPRRD